MTPHQQLFAFAVGGLIFLTIVELIRRRRLREEYSWLWFVTGFVVFVMVVWYDLLIVITEIIGARLPTTTLFLFSVIFLMLINVHYSIKISALTNQVKELAQSLAIHQALAAASRQAGETNQHS